MESEEQKKAREEREAAEQRVSFPRLESKKGVITFEIPKNKYQITKESSERWEFMEKM
jgi:hypothetical protein